jgi:hypothetical protein
VILFAEKKQLYNNKEQSKICNQILYSNRAIANLRNIFCCFFSVNNIT